MVRLGTAGWTVPRAVADHFPAEGTGLERYAAVFNAAEINSTFYKPHRAGTLERWAATVPDHFRFAAKIPKTITHEARLVDTAHMFDRFVEEMTPLGSKLGPLLVQLPPSLAFNPAVAAAFFAHVRSAYVGALACEPRHATWFAPDADALLREHQVARVAADPARVPEAAEPGGWDGLRYWRLHGSPRMYYSSYEPEFLGDLTGDLAAATTDAWCIFDNTVSGAAAANALDVRDRLTPHSSSSGAAKRRPEDPASAT